MTLDKQTLTTTTTTSTEHPLAVNKKTKKWASVRRKFLLITNRSTSSPTSVDTQTAESQAESFCRPFIQNLPEQNPPERDAIPEKDTVERNSLDKKAPEKKAPEKKAPEKKAPEKIGLEKYALDRPCTPEPEPESEWEREIARITKENSERNNNLDLYSSETTKPSKSRRRSKKKKQDKTVRFNEEPDIIPDDGELEESDTESISEESEDEPQPLKGREVTRKMLPAGVRLVQDD